MQTYSKYSWLEETFWRVALDEAFKVAFSIPTAEIFCPLLSEELGPAPLKSTHCGVFQGLSQWDHGNLEVNDANK